MAMVDYRWCSGCGGKCFYDANLYYGDWTERQSDSDQELPWGCADMRALCGKCKAAGWTVNVTPPKEDE